MLQQVAVIERHDVADDRTVDWRSYHDERSLDFNVRDVMPERVRRCRRMHAAHRIRLDQGDDGGSVGHAWTAHLQAEPDSKGGERGRIHRLDAHKFARYLDLEAQILDEWPGESYGTSVLAGARALKRLGLIDSYWWAFDIEDVIDAVVTIGPVVIGVPWYEGMCETRPSGLTERDGDIVGGHCVVLTGYDPAMRLPGEGAAAFEVFRYRNSWGPDYGINGDATILVEDVEQLLRSRWVSEACCVGT